MKLLFQLLYFSTPEFVWLLPFFKNFYLFVESLYLRGIILMLSFSSVDTISCSSLNIFKTVDLKPLFSKFDILACQGQLLH